MSSYISSSLTIPSNVIFIGNNDGNILLGNELRQAHSPLVTAHILQREEDKIIISFFDKDISTEGRSVKYRTQLEYNFEQVYAEQPVQLP